MAEARAPQKKYIHYFVKEGKYSAEFQAENDIEAKIITRRIHGHECDGVSLYRICSPNKTGQRRIKGIQL